MSGGDRQRGVRWAFRRDEVHDQLAGVVRDADEGVQREDLDDKHHEMCEGRTFEEAAIAAIRERRDAICINWFDLAKAKREWAEEEAKIAAMSEEEIIAEEIQLVDHYLTEPGLSAEETAELVARKEALRAGRA